MKLKIINLLIFILLQLALPVALLAVEIAPRISDREIIEKLAILEVGQGALAVRLTDLCSGSIAGSDPANFLVL